MNQETMELRIEKIRARQLARMMSALREVNSPAIIQQAVERYFNYFYQDVVEAIKVTKDQNEQSSK